ncbi:DNA internalization-related competence protein ComEC/Rec2 [Salinicola aestuarinus]|uniref:DNA internalization-related competence protein ComEC/Rec2 n=1 Tax=Salinicola aestuarinus TaxID=1949082 RepID=UPI000DA1EB82|nr:DNA internalization-related competence protein ComEC/Rec2 [Salinicola aestuarinus]
MSGRAPRDGPSVDVDVPTVDVSTRVIHPRCGLAMPVALAALAGALLGRLWAGPDGSWVLVVWLLLAVSLGLSAWRRRWGVGLCLLAFLFCHWQVQDHVSRRLPSDLAGSDFRLEGEIQALQVEAGRTRFRLLIGDCMPQSSASGALVDCPPLHKVRLSWYGAPALRDGERWVLTARLREPIGFANFDTFDYGAWLWREGIDALGYVRKDEAVRREAAPFSLRQQALSRLDAVDLTPRGKRWLAALTLGAGDRLSDNDWALLNATGTTHLMVISGLHVGLVATLVLWLLRALSRLLQPFAWRMALWPWLGAGAAAFGYAALAGFEPPAMRAAIMAGVGLWAASGRHAPGWWQAWWLALALVLLVDPLAPWRPGVWLSFTAVGVLIVAWSGRRAPRGVVGWCYGLLRSQWLLAPVMAAAVLLAFGRLSPAAPLVNLIAVPLVSVALVPAGFVGWLGIVWTPLAAMLWWPFEQLVAGLASALATAADLMPLWEPTPSQRLPLALGFALWGALWVLPGFRGRWRLAVSGAVAVTLLQLKTPTPAEASLVVTVHDVGQGQLVELQTARQRVLVDTGPRFSSGFMPASTLWGPGQTFDAVVVTHSDIDHAGGIEALKAEHHVARWWAPTGNDLGLPSRHCQAGSGWADGNSSWRFLSPPAAVEGLSRNARSCVLLVTLGQHRVLITGDAGTAQEQAWLDTLRTAPIDLLVAGHHGSRSSSSPAFIAASRPQDVVFSSGRGNPYHHPSPEIVARFVAAGSRIWNTAFDGAVRFTLSPSGIDVQTRRKPGWQRRSAVEGEAVGVESSP